MRLKIDLARSQTRGVNITTSIGGKALADSKLSKLEFQIMEVLWAGGELSIREIQERFPGKRVPAYTTIQTTVYRLEAKEVVRRVKKVGNFHVFAASITQKEAQRRIVDDLLSYFGGRSQPVMAHLVESGKLSLEDVKDAERTLKKLSAKEKQ
jgi:predicted transcriptional regulator